VRIVADRLAAVFDWDSLLVGPESTASARPVSWTTP
jgi:hypothetical protein